MKRLPLFLSLLLLITCAKEDSQNPNTPPSDITKQYTLTVSAGEGGSVSTPGGTFSSGTQVSITATPSEGYSFSGWSNGSSDNPLSVTINSNTSVTANFQVIVNSYTLTVTAGEGGSVSSEGGEYEEGTEVTITATPDEGYEFTGWSDGSSEESITLQVNSNLEITANFIKVYALNKESYFNQRSGIAFITEGPHGGGGTPAYTKNLGWTMGFGGFGGGQAYHDVNNDGFQDILASRDYNWDDGVDEKSIDWYINQGDNDTFVIDKSYITSSTVNLSAFKILKTDVNNDNLADFIALGVDERFVGNYGGNFTVLVQNTSGTFDLISIDDGFGLWYHNGAAGDLNGDGNVDVVSATYIWLGDGNGNFTNTEISVEDYGIPSALGYEIIDINNDGYNDIIVGTDEGSSTSGILLGSSNFGAYETIMLPTTGSVGFVDFEFMDVDNDGDLDILEGKYINDGYSSKIFTYINDNLNFSLNESVFSQSLDGNDTNIPPQDVCPGCRDSFGWSRFKIDDIDNDGVDDIVVENFHDGEFTGLKLINNVWTKWSFFQY